MEKQLGWWILDWWRTEYCSVLQLWGAGVMSVLCLPPAYGFWKICKEEIPTASIKLECSLSVVWKLSRRSSSCSVCSLKLTLSDGILSSRELLKIINLWKMWLKHWVLSLETSVLLTSKVWEASVWPTVIVEWWFWGQKMMCLFWPVDLVFPSSDFSTLFLLFLKCDSGVYFLYSWYFVFSVECSWLIQI